MYVCAHIHYIYITHIIYYIYIHREELVVHVFFFSYHSSLNSVSFVFERQCGLVLKSVESGSIRHLLQLSELTSSCKGCQLPKACKYHIDMQLHLFESFVLSAICSVHVYMHVYLISMITHLISILTICLIRCLIYLKIQVNASISSWNKVGFLHFCYLITSFLGFERAFSIRIQNSHKNNKMIT